MKVTVTVEENSGIKLPCLLKSKDDFTLIILASGIEGNNVKGTVLVDSDSGQIGYYAEDWSAGNFEPFNGTITLQND